MSGWSGPNPSMISPMGRGHRGGTLSITSSRGRGSSGNSGARSRHTRADACCGSRGGAVTTEGPAAVEELTPAEESVVEGPAVGGAGP